MTRFVTRRLLTPGTSLTLKGMETINDLLAQGAGLVWGLPLVILLIGAGTTFTILLKGVQFRAFKHAIDVVRGQYSQQSDPGQLTHFQALTTALSATVGLGNIAGVAVAIHIGGPGATFWMIVAGLLGMTTKYVECSLAVKYRKIDSKGVVHGGPMYYIEKGLGKKFKPLAVFFAIAVICGSYGAANMFQSNQVATILYANFGIPALATGITLAVLTAIVIIGGIQRIGKVTEMLVPFMGGIYFLGAMIVIIINFKLIPGMISQILNGAWAGTAAAGGFAGATMKQVLVQGMRRAVFSNEAGLGSAPIAHATASTKEPIREGVVALLEPFIDTVVICTLTAVVILLSGAWNLDASGVELTSIAFDSAIPGFGRYFVPVAVFLFAFSTLISWSYYGERATDYLWGEKGILPYKIIFCLLTAVGAVWAADAVLNFSDMMLGLMAIPNMIALILLFPEVKKDSEIYFKKLASGKFRKH